MNVSEWSLWMRQQTPFWNEWHCEVWTLLLVKGRLQEIHCGQFLVLSLLCLVACWANNTFYTVEKTQVIEVCDQFSQTRKTTVPVVKQYRRLQGGKPWLNQRWADGLTEVRDWGILRVKKTRWVISFEIDFAIKTNVKKNHDVSSGSFSSTSKNMLKLVQMCF